jgi:adenine deaminase
VNSFSISGQIVDLHSRRIHPGTVTVQDGQIASITEDAEAPAHFIMPGFVDAHIHIESSMLTPTAFGQAAVVHGTVATVSDPHEIANVCGVPGVEFMLENAEKTPFNVFFGAPSCVPATGFETAGATLDSKAVEELMKRPDIYYLAEMMNFPGVLHSDPEVMAKLEATKRIGKPVDGHAPGLRGADAAKYAAAGPSTDHECTVLEEALEKVEAGMQILIREGSAAKNYNALHPLLKSHPERVMFCSDDKHPDELIQGHINELVRRSLELGYELFAVLRAACINPVVHYGLPVGTLRQGDPADFIIVNNLEALQVEKTYLKGVVVAENGKSLLPYVEPATINQFRAERRQPSDFAVPVSNSAARLRTIRVLDGQLLTGEAIVDGRIENEVWVADPEKDLLKMLVINRYERLAKPAVAFVTGFGLKKGALASTVAHDCHNLIAIGADDNSLCTAINAVIEHQGGIAVTDGDNADALPLPIAGLISTEDCATAGAAYSKIDKVAKELGTKLAAPFTTLSFLALLVIPALKLSDRGLFDGRTFQFTELEVA